MARRYEDPVEVRAAPGADRPGSFLWRGRLYVIRDVLGHWRERRAWWTSPAALAVHGDGDVHRPAPGTSAARSALSGEREVWRVAASRGRMHGTGVFDLCREVPGPGSEWRLLRITD